MKFKENGIFALARPAAITAARGLSGRAAVAPRCHSADATSMSFFDLKGRTNAGEAVDFATHKGKCVLAVNVARL